MTPEAVPFISGLPDARTRADEIAERLAGGRAFVFLDYDGTLTPIVQDPDDAVLGGAMRDAIRRLGRACAVAVVSGRDLEDVRAKVDLDGIHYAGSHGFDILTADGERHRRGTEHRPALERAAGALESSLADVPGARVERKAYAVAVHFRALQNPDDEPRVEAAVDGAAADEPGLVKTGGKKIFELRPAVAWDKGRAVLLLLDLLGAPDGQERAEAEKSGPTDGERPVPVYVGDDETDEDAFRALPRSGIGVVVAGETDRETAASYALPDTDAVRSFLDELARILTTRAASTASVR